MANTPRKATGFEKPSDVRQDVKTLVMKNPNLTIEELNKAVDKALTGSCSNTTQKKRRVAAVSMLEDVRLEVKQEIRRQKKRDSAKRWRDNNKEKIQEMKKTYYQENKEKIKQKRDLKKLEHQNENKVVVSDNEKSVKTKTKSKTNKVKETKNKTRNKRK